MKFGQTLDRAIYEPWRADYIDYARLKRLLREDEPDEASSSWTEEDEAAFVEELLNVQLEKINVFRVQTYEGLRRRTTSCESRLQCLARRDQGKTLKSLGITEEERELEGGDELARIQEGQSQQESSQGNKREEEGEKEKKKENNDSDQAERSDETVDDIVEDLDKITQEISELEKYSRVNYTGLLKAVKKHDRKRGLSYKVRPLLQVRLAALPFNKEDYSSLLYEISIMYAFARQGQGQGQGQGQEMKSDKSSSRRVSTAFSADETYTSHKFWVHAENLLEVKTLILRRLPILIYGSQGASGSETRAIDPTITTLYFDNRQFDLYMQKLNKAQNASTLRLRWFANFADQAEVALEQKTIRESGDSEDVRVNIKQKYLSSFLAGQYKMEKSIEKVKAQEASTLKHDVEHLQNFILEHDLQPVLRASYTRTAFQIPGDDAVRVSLDTDMVFIREDCIDEDQPCRNRADFHRRDIDEQNMKFPYRDLKSSEIARFPHALLEIKVRRSATRKANSWINDLMTSHLVKEAPRFSKFVHGVATLFEDHVNSFPFWLSALETDIRRDPQDAFVEELEKKAKQESSELAVGSFTGRLSGSSHTPKMGSPVGPQQEMLNHESNGRMQMPGKSKISAEDSRSGIPSMIDGLLSGVLSRAPFSNSKYARAHRQNAVQLPAGVRHPGVLIKDRNPLKIEPKVWLANQRTFVKWQHISVLLASLSLALYNAAAAQQRLAQSLAVLYTLVALFAGAWGWIVYLKRSRMIEARSGRDFDYTLGPVVICLALVAALCLNFGLKVFRELISNIE